MPFEALRRTTRDRKYVVDELQDVMSALKQNATASCSCEERASVLGQLAERLQGLKRKASYRQRSCNHAAASFK